MDDDAEGLTVRDEGRSGIESIAEVFEVEFEFDAEGIDPPGGVQRLDMDDFGMWHFHLPAAITMTFGRVRTVPKM